MFQAPGSFRPLRDSWGSFAELAPRLPERALVLADARVLKLHPKVKQALTASPGRVLVSLPAGEKTKSMRVLESALQRATGLPRSAGVVCVGGGTLGDLATVAAHVFKRGMPLIHVPTTLLAAVDSSVGGKGAVHLRQGSDWVKNAVGVFHYADEGWLCPEIFETLSARQLREGRIEAWKMALSLDARLLRGYLKREPVLSQLVKDARALKMKVCAKDPYEQQGLRQVLNFGHTFGHVFESLSHFRISHGDAVGLGIRCALDVGQALLITRPALASMVEKVLDEKVKAPGREVAAGALKGVHWERILSLLMADKKASASGQLRMVLLRDEGRSEVASVEEAVWRSLLPKWVRGAKP